MKTRYTFGGDEHIYVEMDEEMSLDAFFKSLSMSKAVRDAIISGVTEICPANASFQVKFNPDVIHPDDMLKKLKELEHLAENAEKRLETRIVEIPVYYQDPWTHETLMRFRERHQDPNGTDLEYAASINGFDSVEAFIEAHGDLAETFTPTRNNRSFAQGLLDMGATVCKPRSPNCLECDFQEYCLAFKSDRVDELPTPKPKKNVPTRAGQFLWIESKGKILLESA